MFRIVTIGQNYWRNFYNNSRKEQLLESITPSWKIRSPCYAYRVRKWKWESVFWLISAWKLPLFDHFLVPLESPFWILQGFKANCHLSQLLEKKAWNLKLSKFFTILWLKSNSIIFYIQDSNSKNLLIWGGIFSLPS